MYAGGSSCTRDAEDGVPYGEGAIKAVGRGIPDAPTASAAGSTDERVCTQLVVPA
ncbi:MAG: hypothetical protein ACI3V2_08625 [Faecousia sp.]